MTLNLYNTLTRRKEPFQPRKPGEVTMYCCGVTVYDYCHLGHARSYITWDVVRRYLMWQGYRVHYIQNFTDVDDKILNRAKSEESSMTAVAERYIQAYFEDIRRLNILDAEAYPRVSQNIPAIHQLIQELERKGHAYAVNGDVYYRVKSFPAYGKLSGCQLAQLRTGASGRVASNALADYPKQDLLDFALWKAAKPGEPAWDSPWGRGRPGWHIECSAMIYSLLGEWIDVHGGGGDLVFPHHENEIAQSEAVTGKPLARYWLHNGMVTMTGEKMSKSLGNFITIRQLLETKLPALGDSKVDPMALRLLVLQAHYRKPIDFSEAAITAAHQSWQTLRKGLLFGLRYGKHLGWSSEHPDTTGDETALSSQPVKRFQVAMDDDFNTAGGLAVLFELAKALRREGNRLAHSGKTEISPQNLKQQWFTLIHLAQVLGLETQPEVAPTSSCHSVSEAVVANWVRQRQTARQSGNFTEADRIRDRLRATGIYLVDCDNGETQWHREPVD